MFPALTSMLPGLVSSMAPNLINGMFKGGSSQPSKSSQNRAQLMSLASQVLRPVPAARPVVSRPLPPRPAPAVARQMAPDEKKDDKMLLYVGIGAAALIGVVLLTKK